MHEKIIYGREQLEMLNTHLGAISTFLVGGITTEPSEKEEKQATCLMDTIEENNKIIDECLERTNFISDVIIGKRG